MTGDDIPAWLARYIGLPFVPHGETMEGVDCWGLYVLAHEEAFGWAPPAYTGPAWRKGADASEIGLAAHAYAERWRIIPEGEETFGDCALWRMRAHPIHVGFVVRPGIMLHVEEAAHSVLENYRGKRFHGRLVNFYRHEPA